MIKITHLNMITEEELTAELDKLINGFIREENDRDMPLD